LTRRTFERKRTGLLELLSRPRKQEVFHLRVTAEDAGKARGEPSFVDMGFRRGRKTGGVADKTRQIRMVADKKSYKVGDKARVLVMTGIPDAYLLVTTEGADGAEQKDCGMPRAPTITVEIPIQSSNQPNVFVSAVFLHDDKLYQASKSLKVPAVQQKLQIENPAVEETVFSPGTKPPIRWWRGMRMGNQCKAN